MKRQISDLVSPMLLRCGQCSEIFVDIMFLFSNFLGSYGILESPSWLILPESECDNSTHIFFFYIQIMP